MQSNLPLMKLSPDEERFLRHWMYDEVHFQERQGIAKQLQVQHRVSPADLAALVAVAMPSVSDQQAAGAGPPPKDAPKWPWSDVELHSRLSEARAALAEMRKIVAAGNGNSEN